MVVCTQMKGYDNKKYWNNDSVENSEQHKLEKFYHQTFCVYVVTQLCTLNL